MFFLKKIIKDPLTKMNYGCIKYESKAKASLRSYPWAKQYFCKVMGKQNVFFEKNYKRPIDKNELWVYKI